MDFLDLIPGVPTIKKAFKLGEYLGEATKIGKAVSPWIEKLKSNPLQTLSTLIPFSSERTDQSTVFDIVESSENGKWTVSQINKYKGDCHERIPHIILTEYRITSSSAIQSIRNAIGLIPDGIGTLGKFIPDALSNLVKSFIPDKISVITDFTQLSDSPISDSSKLDFKIFRQELRVMLDVPDVTKVVWPNIPTSASNINIPPFPEI